MYIIIEQLNILSRYMNALKEYTKESKKKRILKKMQWI